MLTHIDDMGVEQDDWTGVWQWHVRDKVPARRFDITFSFRDYSAQFTTRRYGSHVTRSATNDSDEILDMVRSKAAHNSTRIWQQAASLSRVLFPLYDGIEFST